jgi:hypothetical protein
MGFNSSFFLESRMAFCFGKTCILGRCIWLHAGIVTLATMVAAIMWTLAGSDIVAGCSAPRSGLEGGGLLDTVVAWQVAPAVDFGGMLIFCNGI